MNQYIQQPPDWQVEHWLNTDTPLDLISLRGRVVVLYTFQMLCPGCVSHALPQARKVWELFDHDDVAVIGLHTVFEHHEAMSRVSLEAFVHEYRLEFPIGIDQPADDSQIPLTMQAYGLRGTPSLLLFDRFGGLHKSVFGRVSDLSVGAEIMALVMADEPSAPGSRNSFTKGKDGNAPVCGL